MKQQKQINKTKGKRSNPPLPPPSDDRIAELALLLNQQQKQETVRKRYARVSRVLTILGTGAVLSLALFVAPPAIMLAKPFLDKKREDEQNEWKHFNPRYLRRTIASLRKQKLVSIEYKGKESIVTLTTDGKRRVLRYALDNLSIQKPASWDGRWRLVIYDIPKPQSRLRDVLRETLITLGFYKLQESVWLNPYPCESEITFLREYYGLGGEVLYIIAVKLEDDTPFRTYFNLS